MSPAMTALDRCSVPGSPCRLRDLEQPGPRPGWAALDAAGQRRFTGSLTLHLAPDVRVWFHDGHVLYAERDGDPSIEARLLDAGVVTSEQLARGVVALGPVRHLGRLFDRVPELDRDVVELAVELTTAELLGEIADRVADAVTVEPYRQHTSGLHHWVERTSEQPLEAAAQRVRDRALEPSTAPTAVATSAPAPIASMVPAPSAPVEDDANVAVVPTPATNRPVDEPVADRAVVDASPVVDAQQTTDHRPVVEPHPPIDLRRVIEEVAAETRGDSPDAPWHLSPDDLVPAGDATEVPDDVRAAVRLALAEIMAATRPSITEGLSVASLVDPHADPHAEHGDADEPPHGHDRHHHDDQHGADDHAAAGDHHGLRRLLGGRHT